MSNVKTEGRHAGEFVLAEADFLHCRDEITVSEGQVLEAGTVLQADGDEFVMLDSGSAAAVVLYNVDASEGAKKVAAIVRGPCQLMSSMLVFASGTSDGDKAAAFDDLKALGIVVRESA